jgi:hypothetical protein
MRTIVCALSTMLFLTFSQAGSSLAGSTNSITELAANQTVMQCMTNCIKHEGNTASAKSTCKLRCANVPMPGAKGNKGDCMGNYKKCNRSCKKSDKSCRKVCKAKLMQCK